MIVPWLELQRHNQKPQCLGQWRHDITTSCDVTFGVSLEEEVLVALKFGWRLPLWGERRKRAGGGGKLPPMPLPVGRPESYCLGRCTHTPFLT